MKRTRKVNGYTLVYAPKHPNAQKSKNWSGYVYEHILVMSRHLNRPLMTGEVVHHKDENRSNNALDNLELLDRSKHASLHARRKPRPLCPCGTPVKYPRGMYCSYQCRNLFSRKVSRPSKQELKYMLLNESMCAAGRRFGVSDNAVRKWAVAYGLL